MEGRAPCAIAAQGTPATLIVGTEEGWATRAERMPLALDCTTVSVNATYQELTYKECLDD